MWLIALLACVVDACPVDFHRSLLEMIQVSTWLLDEYRIFTQEEYALDVLTKLLQDSASLTVPRLGVCNQCMCQ